MRSESVSGGGLATSPIAGMVTLDPTTNSDGTKTPGATVPFVGGASPDSGLEIKKGNGPTSATVIPPKSRVYWFIQQ